MSDDEALAAWRAGERGVHDVTDVIHEFHQRTARALWGTYAHGAPVLAVRHAVHTGVLRADELPADVAALLAAHDWPAVADEP